MPLAADARYAVRQLRGNPGFTVVVLATLCLCIGANTAIYSVLDAVVLRPLPYPEPDRLAMVVTAYVQRGREETDFSQTGALFEAVRAGAPGLDSAAYSSQSGVNFIGRGRPAYVQQQRVSAGFFRVLGVSPLIGHEFSVREDVPDGPPLVVLSYEFWQRAFRGDRGIVGDTIKLRGRLYKVIGILPGGFRSPSEPSLADPTRLPVDLWTPLQPSPSGEGSGSNYDVVARLKPGVSWPEATGQLQALSHGLMQMPGFPREALEFEERIVPFQSALTRDVRAGLYITWAAVLAVLLIGCVNVAGLLLAHFPARSREIATRLALGASRAAIVRQLIVESLVLALGGCAAGLLLGAFAVDWLKGLGAVNFEIVQPIELDWRVMAAMFGIALLTSFVFGLFPAIQTSRLDIRSVLMEAGRGVAGGRRNGTRSVLVAGEVALSLVLLVGAGLLVRTLIYFYGLSPGFDTRNLIVAESSLLDARYEKQDDIADLFHRGLERIRAIPGVASAAAALTLPYERPLNEGYKQLDGFTGEPPRTRMSEMVYVTPGYFETLSMPLLQGRTFRESDTPESGKVAVVSLTFARTVFRSGGAALGHRLRIENKDCEIVGVVGDVEQHSGLGDSRAPISVDPTVYLAMAQSPTGFLWFSPKWVVRTSASPARMEPKIQDAIATVDPFLPISRFRTMDELSGVFLQEQRYMAALFSMMAALALALAAIGLYGLISSMIAQRRYELGIRLALGATARQAIAAAMKPGIVLALIGIAAGAVLARATVRLLESMIWGIQPTDPLTFCATAGVLLAVAAVASLVPALRILWLEPSKTLRNQ
jgi:predicted permease